MNKRMIMALAVAGTVFASVFGMAASLGTIGSSGVGAGNGAVGSCDSDGVGTSYANAWDATDKRYEVTSVNVSGIADSCDGKTLKVALTDSANASLGDGSVTVPSGTGTSATVSSLSTNPSAAAVANVHVVLGD